MAVSYAGLYSDDGFQRLASTVLDDRRPPYADDVIVYVCATNSGFAEHLDFLEISSGAMKWDVLEKEERS